MIKIKDNIKLNGGELETIIAELKNREYQIILSNEKLYIKTKTKRIEVENSDIKHIKEKSELDKLKYYTKLSLYIIGILITFLIAGFILYNLYSNSIELALICGIIIAGPAIFIICMLMDSYDTTTRKKHFTR